MIYIYIRHILKPVDYLSVITFPSVLFAGAENCRIVRTVRPLIRLSHDYSQHND